MLLEGGSMGQGSMGRPSLDEGSWIDGGIGLDGLRRQMIWR